MDLKAVNQRGLVLVGCGRMGGAMLQGWLAQGLNPASVWVQDPAADPAKLAGVHLNAALPDNPAVMVLAVKPQMMGDVLPALRAAAGPETLILSIAAGVTLARYEAAFPGRAVVRAMPNTPAAIGQGITAMIGNPLATQDNLDLAQALLAAVGRVVRLGDESQMDAVTALSGSGPAYVFHLIEALALAGQAQGLAPALALELARATVAGAGALAVAGDEDPAVLRQNVTSPGGTTAAGLAVLMDPAQGLPPLIARTVEAAANRSRELGA
ncbi:MAG: pyrroline-5-carboxylate reductase [Paracoccus sp. (in: a-proteobacteria)]|uniref:pyrroline-5-carboxylate reductase n=1 Tax=Paracoccus sp. TaxID=267 RepID=UPI0026E02A2B|nr:pyrroline-5-carboxylate reductase [Paracoccus sp. (in: a-proteobacteria)]MDO5622204.1 pyrroline-5-carboxylate reductase [Paracoccus sp. (in: a-proteobacteria)]